jgi:hypothetical protein
VAQVFCRRLVTGIESGVAKNHFRVRLAEIVSINRHIWAIVDELAQNLIALSVEAKGDCEVDSGIADGRLR